MIKNILVCVDGSKYAETAIHAAVWLGKKLKAQLRALSVVDVRRLEGPWLADLSGLAGVQPFQAMAPQLRDLYEQKARLAMNEATAAARRGGIVCETEMRTGLPVENILNAEASVELVVLGQR